MRAIFTHDMTLDEFIIKYREHVLDGVLMPMTKLKSLSIGERVIFNLFIAGKGIKMRYTTVTVPVTTPMYPTSVN